MRRAYLNPELTIIYEDRRGEETEHIVYHEPEGIKGFVKDLNKSTEVLHDVVYFKGETEGITVEAAFQYTNEFHENILGFCNNIFNAEGGTHITGFKTVFTTVINAYARELGILKDKDANFTGADVRNGMTQSSPSSTRIRASRDRRRRSWITRTRRGRRRR